jgi:hypothetical protein
MNQTTTIPITIAPEAAEYVQKLGMQREFNQMVEHVRQTAPDLRSIEVNLEPPYDTGDEDRVVIFAFRECPNVLEDQWDDQWRHWEIQTFSPDVLRHFVTTTIYLP